MKAFAIALVSLGLICATHPTLAQVQPQPAGSRNVQVAAGDLGDAVESLGKQAGVNVLYPGDLLKGRTTAGVAGTLSPAEAFAKLLEGTSLTVTQEYGAMRIAMTSSPKPVAARTVPLEQESRPMKQADVPVTARWERRELHYSRDYGQRREDIERTLKWLGARDVEGSSAQATCLVLVLAPPDGHGTPDSFNVTARWERVTVRAESGFKQGEPDWVSPILFDELKKDILRLFVTRNLEEKSRDSLSVEVLYPVAAAAKLPHPAAFKEATPGAMRISQAASPKPVATPTEAVKTAAQAPAKSSCRNVSSLTGIVQRMCGTAAQWAEFDSRMAKLDVGFSCRRLPGARPLCLFPKQWQYVERNDLLRTNTQHNGFGFGDNARQSAMAIEHNEANAVRQDLINAANGRPLPIP